MNRNIKIDSRARREIHRMRCGEVLHNRLQSYQEALARALFNRVAMHVFATFEDFEAGLRRYLNPTDPLISWELIARTFEGHIAEYPTIDRRYCVLCLWAISNDGRFFPETFQTREMRGSWLAIRHDATEDLEGFVNEMNRQSGE